MPQKVAVKASTTNQSLVLKPINQVHKPESQPVSSQASAYTALKAVSASHRRRLIRAYSLACFCFSGSSVVMGLSNFRFYLLKKVRSGLKSKKCLRSVCKPHAPPQWGFCPAGNIKMPQVGL